MQKALDLLLTKYSVADAAKLSQDGGCVRIGDTCYSVFPWEAERRFIELRNLGLTGRLGNPCTYRIGHTVAAGSDLFSVLEREVGVLEFTLGSRVLEVFAICGQNTMNCILETENGCVCTVELGATLQAGECEIDKHEIITDRGVACDRVVDTQVPQQSIYVFGKQPAAYTDTDAELYGYSEKQIPVIRKAFRLAQSAEERDENAGKRAHLDAVIAAAKQSIATLENVKVGE